MTSQTISTDRAPAAIGAYSQAVRAADTVYLSGQIPLSPDTMELITGDISAQMRQVFDNLAALTAAAGGSLADIVKMNVYLVDLDNFSLLNEIMREYFQPPFPARAVLGVAALPKGAQLEIDAILHLPVPSS